jgi:hypothetical protein
MVVVEDKMMKGPEWIDFEVVRLSLQPVTRNLCLCQRPKADGRSQRKKDLQEQEECLNRKRSDSRRQRVSPKSFLKVVGEKEVDIMM